MKQLFTSAMLLACLAAPNVAQAQTNVSTDVYHFDQYDDKKLIELFYDVMKQGRTYPTAQEFAQAGLLASDIETLRSHIRPRAILSRADRLVQDTYENRNLWANLPMHSGKGGGIGFPSDDWNSDVFSLWNYTEMFGTWNHGWFQAPGAWADAAHKNGSTLLSGLKFFDTTGGRTGGAGTYISFITAKESDGTFKYVKPIIHILKYFGTDGINYNFETSGYDYPDVMAFHKALYKYAQEIGFTTYRMGLYTNNASLSSYRVDALFGTTDTGRSAHLMLNYSGNNITSSCGSSVRTAVSSMGTAEGLYAGIWIVDMNRSWNRLNNAYIWGSGYTPDADAKKCGIAIWGEHADSRFWSYNTGTDTYNRQSNYQRLLERGFSGGNRNPLNRPILVESGIEWQGENALTKFAGFAEWIPERSAISGNLPFATYFNLGNGERYYYKGKRSAGAWYNMANQDVVPTYRWLVVNAGTENVATNLQPSFYFKDAYMGGTSLNLKGTLDATGTDVVLYKTNLTVSAAKSVAKLAVKAPQAGASNLYLILKVNDAWREYAVGDLSDKTWQEVSLPLNLNVNDVITRVGLRMKGSGEADLLVGKLELNDDSWLTPSDVQNVVVEVTGETKTTISTKINWDVNKAPDAYGMVGNDEANIDHFEIMYRDGEDGKVYEVGRTTQWTTYVGNIQVDDAQNPMIGVRAVSKDLKSYTEVQWVTVPRGDIASLPDAKPTNDYGSVYNDPNGPKPQEAVDYRYLVDVHTTGAVQDLQYSGGAFAPATTGDTRNYIYHTANKLVVRQGQTLDLYFRAYNHSSGLKWCVTKAWIDFDGDKEFDGNAVQNVPGNRGELVYEYGDSYKGNPEIQTGVTKSITIPSDARLGNTRLRICFSDAWFPGQCTPTGALSTGYALDLDVEIQGDNQDYRMPIDTRDQGEVESPNIVVPTKVENVVNGNGVSTVAVQNGEVVFRNVDVAWVYTLDGSMVKMLERPTTIGTATLPQGVYLVKMKRGSVIRSQKLVVK